MGRTERVIKALLVTLDAATFTLTTGEARKLAAVVAAGEAEIHRLQQEAVENEEAEETINE